MIYFVGPAKADGFIKMYKLLYRLAPKYVSLYPDVDRITYEELLNIPDLHLFPGTYVFRNFCELSQRRLSRLVAIAENLEARNGMFRVFNHPRRVRGRFELLRLLHETGINNHNAYRLTELPRPTQWPVFLRSELGHWKGPLLHNRSELDEASESLMKGGILRSDALVVEFNDTKTVDGLYVQYGALRLGDRIVPHFRSVSQHWDGARFDYEFMYSNSRFLEAEVEYIIENPHASVIMDIFKLANVDFGRMDYAMLDGKIQVWEINTNPEWIRLAHIRDERLKSFNKHFSRAFAEALYAIDSISA